MNNIEYEQIVKKNIDMIYRIAISHTKVSSDADDIVQQTFLKLLTKSVDFKDEEHIKRWLIRVCVNECNSLFSSFWRKNVGPIDEISETPVFDTPEHSELFGKVMNMNKKKLKVKNVLKHAAIAFSAFAVLFAASNTICYATTGETLIEKTIVYINGELYTEADINWTQNGDTLVGEISLPDSDVTIIQPIEIPNENGKVVVEDVQIEVNDSSVNLYLVDDTTTPRNNVLLLEEKDARIYLVLADKRIDITEDFADGTATGEIMYDDMTYIYTVSGDIQSHDIALEEYLK